MFMAGETGRTIRLNAGFDMSENTDIKIVFVDPDGVTYEKGAADGVTLKADQVTDPVLGELLPNQYVEYEAEAELFQIKGRWRMYIKYENHNITPPENLFGKPVRITVKARPEQIIEESGCDC